MSCFLAKVSLNLFSAQRVIPSRHRGPNPTADAFGPKCFTLAEIETYSIISCISCTTCSVTGDRPMMLLRSSTSFCPVHLCNLLLKGQLSFWSKSLLLIVLRHSCQTWMLRVDVFWRLAQPCFWLLQLSGRLNG